MATGKPVIGLEEGGLLETVIHGETDWLSSPNTSLEELVQMLDAANPKLARSMRFSCEKQATHFRTELFINKIKVSLG